MSSISSAESLEEPIEAPSRGDTQETIKAAETPRDHSRNQTIDVIRFFAAAGIVFIHSEKSTTFDELGNLFRFAVPFYLFASLYYQSMSLRSHTDRTLFQYIAGRFKRLYFPFLGWSMIYLAARDLNRIAILHLPAVELRPSLFWTGTEYHLWFLPFLLMSSIIFAVVHWTLLRRDRVWRWPLITIAVAAGLTVALAHMPSGWDETFDNPTYAYVQWWRSLTPTCWAMAFAWFMTMGPVVYAVSPVMGSAGIVLAAFVSVEQVFKGLQLIPRGLSGLGCMIAALAPWKTAAGSVLARLGRYSYAIYLSHALIVEIIHAAIYRHNLELSMGLDLITFTLSFAGSILLAIALGHSRRLAWLNG